ncbi:hypothetical protein AUJ17_01070 [Candidatus Micrarchaeota archaeon CG1_02_47_40]|nr:MAG: hypothetical protein AUJ17_01070 [Candidatus Micrarchaeota archaeon CG1_02_47_40]
MDISYVSEFEAYTNDLRWLSNNLDSLRPEYENKFVLVKNRQVIAANASYDQLIIEAAKQKIDVSKAVIERILSKNVQLLL